jgi:hypothetical protein
VELENTWYLIKLTAAEFVVAFSLSWAVTKLAFQLFPPEPTYMVAFLFGVIAVVAAWVTFRVGLAEVLNNILS